jgi:hypothetical protein
MRNPKDRSGWDEYFEYVDTKDTNRKAHARKKAKRARKQTHHEIDEILREHPTRRP